MFRRSKSNATENESSSAEEKEAQETLTRILQRQEVGPAPYPSKPPASESISSIDADLSIEGKIVGNGSVAIFGHVEGEVRASTVRIGEGALVEGNIIADELTIGGHVKGTVHANRVKLNSTAVVEGDIYHRSLAIEEKAQFDGMSRRQENIIDIPSLVPAKFPQSQADSISERGSNFPDDVNQPQSVSSERGEQGNGNDATRAVES